MGRLSIETPVGPIWVAETDGAITGAGWGHVETPDDTPLLRATASELRAYFDGRLDRFTIPIRHRRDGAAGKVLDAMLAIPLGETRRYGEIAEAVGLPAQAVGQACGGNVIPILIPCHRVLSASGLGGYSGQGGVETKVWLLRHEGAAGLLI